MLRSSSSSPDFHGNDIEPTINEHASVLDSALWFLFYAIVAIAFILLVKGIKLPNWYFVLAVLACFAEMISSGPGLWENLFGEKTFTMTQVSMSAEDPRVELSREFFGAVITFAAVLFQLWQIKRKKA